MNRFNKYGRKKLKDSKVDEAFPSHYGVDTIEDLLDKGYDYSDFDDDQFENSYDPDFERDDGEYEINSPVMTIAQAEKIIGERPDGSKPKPPSSKNPRPSTLKAYQDALASYKDRLKALNQWEKDYDHLSLLAEDLLDDKKKVSDLLDYYDSWVSETNHDSILQNIGKNTYINVTRTPMMKIFGEAIDSINFPEKLTSKVKTWKLDQIAFDSNDDVIDSAMMLINKYHMQFIATPISMTEELEEGIERIIDKIEPKDIKSMSRVKLNRPVQQLIDQWSSDGVLNKDLSEEDRMKKLYLLETIVETELKSIKDINVPFTLSPILEMLV